MDLTKYYQHPGFLIRRCHQIVLSLYDDLVAPIPTTVQQLAILHAVAALGEADQGSVAEAIGIDRSTITAITARLMTRGLLHARPAPEDRRRKILTITAAGLEHVHDLLRRTRKLRKQFLSPLAPDEQRTLLDLLQRLAQAHNAESRVPQTAHDHYAA